HDCRTGAIRDIVECALAGVVIKNARFPILRAQLELIDLRINVAVYKKQVGPAVVVEVEEHRSPAEILGVQSDAGGESGIGEGSIAIVVIERGAVVGEVGFEDIEAAIAIVVGHGRAHACLLASVFVEGGACDYRNVGESSIVVVAIENARRAVAGDVDVRPAVVIEIKRRDAEGIMSSSLLDARLLADI